MPVFDEILHKKFLALVCKYKFKYFSMCVVMVWPYAFTTKILKCYYLNNYLFNIYISIVRFVPTGVKKAAKVL